MTNEEIFEKVKKLIAERLAVNESKIVPEASFIEDFRFRYVQCRSGKRPLLR